MVLLLKKECACHNCEACDICLENLSQSRKCFKESKS